MLSVGRYLLGGRHYGILKLVSDVHGRVNEEATDFAYMCPNPNHNN